MIDSDVKEEAIAIGSDSYELQHFIQLPESASKEQQVEALNRDRNWQRDHFEEISGRIDVLIQQVEI